jgi:hypothetical protein
MGLAVIQAQLANTVSGKYRNILLNRIGMYERFRGAARANIVAISRRDLKVMDQALTYAEGLVPKQGGEDISSELEARVNVVCSQVYIVARILLALIEARSGRKTSIELLKTRALSDAGR